MMSNLPLNFRLVQGQAGGMNTASLEMAFLVALLLASVGLFGCWGYREGFRQGDGPADPTAEARLVSGWDDQLALRVSVVNPTDRPVVASIGHRSIGRPWAAVTPGRSTRRRCEVGAEDELLAVDAHGEASRSWLVCAPGPGAGFFVNIHIAQHAGRVRQHRVILRPAAPAAVL